MLAETTALRKVSALKKKTRVLQGGTSAGKTIAVIADLIDLAQRDKVPTVTDVVSETMPHLRMGAMSDFQNIMKQHNYWQPQCWHDTTPTMYTFETGSSIRFFGADDQDKVRGPRRDRLFINECNNVPYGVYDQLAIRTRQTTWLDFNPVSRFWVHDLVMPHHDHDYLQLTYLDNEALDEGTRHEIELRRELNPAWWKVYGLGEIGVKEGQIYEGWMPIDEIPAEATLLATGLDWGYSNGPTAIADVYSWKTVNQQTGEREQSLVFDELMYRKGIHNKEIAEFLLGMQSQEYGVVVADSEDPKSIDDVNGYGVNIVGIEKPRGSVNNGIDLMQDQRIYVTKQSVNIWDEYREYLWKLNRDNQPMNVPAPGNDHLMDALRYAVTYAIGNAPGDFVTTTHDSPAMQTGGLRSKTF